MRCSMSSVSRDWPCWPSTELTCSVSLRMRSFRPSIVRGSPFEQLVHVVAVVSAKAFADVDVTELAGRYVHAVMLGRATWAR